MELIKDNWYLFIALGLVISAGVVMMIMESDDSGPVAAERPAAMAGAEVVQNQQPTGMAFGKRPESSTQEDQTRKVIASHRATVEANPESEDAPGLLAAMGNLYQRLGEYEQAAQCYEKVLMDHPDWKGITNVYSQIVVCYEKCDDEVGKKWIYRKIMDDFPEDTLEYDYAKTKLGLN